MPIRGIVGLRRRRSCRWSNIWDLLVGNQKLILIKCPSISEGLGPISQANCTIRLQGWWGINRWIYMVVYLWRNTFHLYPMTIRSQKLKISSMICIRNKNISNHNQTYIQMYKKALTGSSSCNQQISLRMATIRWHCRIESHHYQI